MFDDARSMSLGVLLSRYAQANRDYARDNNDFSFAEIEHFHGELVRRYSELERFGDRISMGVLGKETLSNPTSSSNNKEPMSSSEEAGN